MAGKYSLSVLKQWLYILGGADTIFFNTTHTHTHMHLYTDIIYISDLTWSISTLFLWLFCFSNVPETESVSVAWYNNYYLLGESLSDQR